MTTATNQQTGRNWTMIHADCVEALADLPDNSIGCSVFSPPFSGLYIYSDSERDMGNSASDDEFFEHYKLFLSHLFRVTKPGRQVWVHCKDLVYYQNQGGTAGLRDFPGELVRAHVEAGFDYHARFTIWRDPVREMQKTKANGLLWKTLRQDSTLSRSGLPEYFVVFRKWPKDGEETDPVTHTKSGFPVDQWQQWASPVWMDTRETNTLEAKIATASGDEKHICPMPLDLTERAITMGSNPDDVVLSPFAGIGSEGYVAVKLGRKFVGVELKESYWKQACRNIGQAEAQSAYGGLFDAAQ